MRLDRHLPPGWWGKGANKAATVRRWGTLGLEVGRRGFLAISRAPASFTCHEHHEDRSAPLGRRDGGRNGALEPQHRSSQVQVLAGSVVRAVLELAPPSSSSDPKAPAAPTGPPPASCYARTRKPVSCLWGQSAPRHVTPYVADGAVPPGQSRSQFGVCVRAPARP